jgi:MarR family transcriptional regulator, 2-MHQ and catechol-resistance regulon repressor
LVAKGLVTREPSPDDRRARYAVLTREGKQLIADIFPAHAAFLTGMISTLSEREQLEATALLRKLGLGAAARAEESP